MTHHDPTFQGLSVSPRPGHERLCALREGPDIDTFRQDLGRRMLRFGASEVRQTSRRDTEHPGDTLLFYTPEHTYLALAHSPSWEVLPHPLLTLDLVHHWDVYQVHIDPEHLSTLRTLRAKLARKRRHADFRRPRVPVRHHRLGGTPAELRARITGLEYELDRALGTQRHYIARGEAPAWHLMQLVFSPNPQLIRLRHGLTDHYDTRLPFDSLAEHALRWHTTPLHTINTALFTYMNP